MPAYHSIFTIFSLQFSVFLPGLILLFLCTSVGINLAFPKEMLNSTGLISRDELIIAFTEASSIKIIINYVLLFL